MGNLGRKALLGLAVPSAKDVLSKLAAKEILSVLEKLEKKNKKKSGLGATKQVEGEP